MKKSIFILLSFLIIQNSHAWPELPFCPSGGPPGWMNYFDYKRDQNNWRNQQRQQWRQLYSPYQYSPRGAYPYQSFNHNPLRQSPQFNSPHTLRQHN